MIISTSWFGIGISPGSLWWSDISLGSGWPFEVSLYMYLTNRFHVAVRLFSDRSQMTSKCVKNKNVGHEAIVECVTDDDDDDKICRFRSSILLLL